MKFPCTQCSACCKRVGQNLSKMRKLGFPYGVKEGTTVCEKLTEDGKCSVYHNRPDCCSIDKMYYKCWSHLGKTKKDIFKMEAGICNRFITEDGLDKKYLIDINSIR